MTNSERATVELTAALIKNGGAECEQVPEIFYPSEWPHALQAQADISLAKKICARCPIRLECLDAAISTREAHGIWGGFTAAERAVLLSSRGV